MGRACYKATKTPSNLVWEAKKQHYAADLCRFLDNFDIYDVTDGPGIKNPNKFVKSFLQHLSHRGIMIFFKKITKNAFNQ